MNFFIINKFFILSLFIMLSACNTSNIYDTLKIKTYESPNVENYDDNDIFLNDSNNFKFNYKKKFVLKNIKNKNSNYNNIILDNPNIYALSNNLELIQFDYNTGEQIFLKKIDIETINDDSVISFNFVDNSFIIAFKSGSILRINRLGEIIWIFKSNKTLNTPLKIINKQLVSLYVDEIKSFSINDGSEIWSEIYEDIPVYQAQGGQLVNFNNLLFFILPNNKVGSIDLNIGLPNNSEFNNMPLISAINNTNDKIHIFDNYLVYLDEGKYLYTFDIFLNDFILFKFNINESESNIFFNNSLILKDGNFLQALNIINGKTFWLIDNKKISKKATIKGIRNSKENIEIYLTNGDIISIKNKKFVEKKDLGINNINNLNFKKNNIIVNTESGKTIIY